MNEVAEDFLTGNADERELLLDCLGFLRGAVLRKVAGLNDDDARWTPEGKLISLVGILNHLTHVEWRWIDGGISPRRFSEARTSSLLARS